MLLYLLGYLFHTLSRIVEILLLISYIGESNLIRTLRINGLKVYDSIFILYINLNSIRIYVVSIS